MVKDTGLMNVVVDIVLVIAGVVLVFVVLDSALRTFVLPRGERTVLTRLVFVSLRWCFDQVARESRTYEQRDRVMALYAPIGLLGLVFVWVVLVVGAYTMLFRAVSVSGWRDAFELSGSSFFTLGFVVPPQNLASYSLAFTEAAAGLALLALLIAYLPTIYGAFSRREIPIARLAVRGGTPPSGVEILTRAERMQRFDLLDEVWTDWQVWFAELEETHTSLAILTFFRSPRHDRSWVTSAGAVLDAASLYNSALAVPWSPNAAAGDRRLLRHPLRPRPESGRPDLHRPQRVRRCTAGAGRRRTPGADRPRPGMARVRGLAGELRRGADRSRRAHDGTVRAMVVGSLDAVPAPVGAPASRARIHVR
jgi:hypothetical protein